MAIIEQAGAHTRLGEEVVDVAERLCQITVQVREDKFSGGSGVIWQASGLIITNAHVVRGQHATVELFNGRVFEAVVVARDPQRDLAALKIEATELPVATIGNSEALRVGELVLAIGNPLGLIGALTTGIVHAISPVGTLSRQRWIKADVRLAPGNSGGPLADSQGRVIGINSMIVGGLALAVPSKAVESFISTSEARPYLGVTVNPVLVSPQGKRLVGLLVLKVAPGSAADKAGLLIGDILIQAASQLFKAPDDFARLVGTTKVGDGLQLELIRGGKCLTCDLIVDSQPLATEAM
jgi:serine protease Do